MRFKIIDRQSHRKGQILTISVQKKIIRILFLFHAIERIEKWGIKEEMVIETLLFPEEVFEGHRDRYIAHRRYNDHLIRAIYDYEGMLPVLVTVYFPHKDRYFKGGGIYEDKILTRR